MKRLRFQVILLSLCLVAVLVAKHYVDKVVREGGGVAPSGAVDGVTVQTAAEAPANAGVASSSAPGQTSAQR